MKMNLLIYLIKEKFLNSNKPNLKLVDKKKLIESSKIKKSKKNFVMKITSLKKKHLMPLQVVRLQMIWISKIFLRLITVKPRVLILAKLKVKLVTVRWTVLVDLVKDLKRGEGKLKKRKRQKKQPRKNSQPLIRWMPKKEEKKRRKFRQLNLSQRMRWRARN